MRVVRYGVQKCEKICAGEFEGVAFHLHNTCVIAVMLEKY